jgi:hypothetical protein
VSTFQSFGCIRLTTMLYREAYRSHESAVEVRNGRRFHLDIPHTGIRGVMLNHRSNFIFGFNYNSAASVR